jgi:hypothetical protein
MTTTQDLYARTLLDLYRTDIRDFLVENRITNLAALDQNAELLQAALEQAGDVKVGFVGESQVGKSTLVNALLDRLALPSGGIGPLTAQATRVMYADENTLEVSYHTKQQLHRHAFAIARYLERRGDLGAGADDAEDEGRDGDEGAEQLAQRATFSPQAAEEQGGAGTSGAKTELGEYMLNQAKRILTHKNPTLEGESPSGVTLLDGMRAILGQRPRGDGAGLPALQERLREVAHLVGKVESLTESALGGTQPFNRALNLRATGWVSPLVSRLQLRLKSDVLRGLSLVDLPGIGVLNDPAGQEAEHFVRTEGDALVVVFRNNGMTESIAELLERTGVITKLLFGGRDGVPPIHLTIVVTHLDDVARDRYRSALQEARDSGEPAPDRNELFRKLSDEMSAKLREMIGDALRKSKAFEDLPQDQARAREQVISDLCASMQVLCVAAPDYLNMTLRLEDGSEFLRDGEATGIPALRSHLASLARNASNRRARVIAQFERALRHSIKDHLRSIAHMYEEGRGIAIQESERFRDELTGAAEPLRREMAAYHGKALGVLREAMQSEIQMICKDAETMGYKKLQRLSRHGRELHYASLRAALTRGGVWDRRDINYPEALTLAMVDSVASQWEPKVIERVREEIRALADRDLALVERLCADAERVDPRIVADSSIETQKKILRANSRTAVAWTKEQLEELRVAVSRSLRSAVERPIERSCEKAIAVGAHYGAGAKNRILDAFEQGGEAAIEEARGAAEESLKKHYSAMLRKLNEGFLKENHDPVQAALDTLTTDEITRARRSDAQRKRYVLTKVASFDAQLGEADRVVAA